MRWLGEPHRAGAWSSWRPVLLARRGRWVGAVSGTVMGEFDTKDEAMAAVENWMEQHTP